MNQKRIVATAAGIAIAIVLLLAGCTAGPNSAVNTAAIATATPAGFLIGIWHGIIAPIAFVVSLFQPGIGIYETHNDGNLYNAGFVIGFLLAWGSASSAIRRRR